MLRKMELSAHTVEDRALCQEIQRNVQDWKQQNGAGNEGAKGKLQQRNEVIITRKSPVGESLAMCATPMMRYIMRMANVEQLQSSTE